MKRSSHRITFATALLSLGLLLGACGDSTDEPREPVETEDSTRGTATPTATPTSSETTQAPEEKPETTDPAAPKNEPSKDAFKTKSSMPKDFPKSLPLPKNGNLAGATATVDGWTLEYRSVNASARSAFQKDIVAAGGVLMFEVPAGEVTMYEYTLPDHHVQLLWTAKAKKTETQLAYVVSRNDS